MLPQNLEIAAFLVALAVQVLAVRRRLALFPTAMVGSFLYVLVFAQKALLFSAALQIVFVVLQAYGWWYWKRGAFGASPPVTCMGRRFSILLVATVLGSGSLAWVIGPAIGAKLAVLDAVIAGGSILAEFLLSRKILENWYAWCMVYLFGVVAYAAAGLYLTSLLCALLFGLSILGVRTWKRAMPDA